MGPLLVLAFIVTPLAELYVFIRVGDAIGFLPTIAILLASSLAGAALVRREGRRAWAALTAAVSGGRLPGREVADGALLLVGGTLLLAPGFITDVLGLLLVLPPTRPLARRFLARVAARRVGVRYVSTSRTRRGRGTGSDEVIEAEVVDAEIIDAEIVDDTER